MSLLTPAMLDALVAAWTCDEGWGESPAIQARDYRIVPTAPGSSKKVILPVEPEGWWDRFRHVRGRTNLDAVGPIPPGFALCSGCGYFHTPHLFVHLRQDVPWNEAIAAMERDDFTPEPFEEVRFG
jgi:hypothetical protein